MTKYLGIDPGFTGALATLEFDPVTKQLGKLKMYDMPTYFKENNRRALDISILKTILLDEAPDHVIIEQVASRPGDGAVGAFSFGTTYGILLGLLAGLGIPHTTVLPQVWKKDLNVPANKDEARARASQLMPLYSPFWVLKKHDGRAEAALIALHGIRRLT